MDAEAFDISREDIWEHLRVLGEIDVFVKPLDDFDETVIPQTWGKYFFQCGGIELPDLPPRPRSMLQLIFDNGNATSIGLE